MTPLRFLLLPCIVCLAAVAQTIDVGSGAPTPAIQAAFLNAYFRAGFNNLVTLPPVGDVKKLGASGLVQEFVDNQKSKYALVKPNILDTFDVLQMYPGLYSYYSSIGSTTAGYPTTDTTNCPGLAQSVNSCQYQLFDKPYALFVYAASVQATGTNFATRNPFYTKWQALGGISGIGPANSAEQSITSSFGTAATVQTFDQGAIFNYTAGTLSGRIVGITSAVYAVYVTANRWSGSLGVPIADELVLADGRRRQTFEGGSIDYVPGSGGVLRPPIQDLLLNPQTSLKLNAGDSVTVQATAFGANGNQLTDRTISWSTSNNRVISIQPSGYTATLKAVGAGSATITASSEGKSSLPLQVLVTAPCCAIGEGAPTAAVQQAFQDAVNRNRLAVQTPAAGPVRRLGSGYVQELQDAATGLPYLVAASDHSLIAHVVSGALLAKYNDLGGPAGSLGYPASDATAAGRQLFENQAALAGSPVRLVAGAFLTKWASLGYETGIAGPPTADITNVLSFRGTMAQSQSFRNGVMVMATSGAAAGKVYFAGGLVYAAYTQSGGAAGPLGLPLADESSSDAARRQDFEGGYIDYAPGDALAQVHAGDRKPVVTATPAAVIAGGRVRLAVGGFNAGSTVRVSVTGQQDFLVATDNGAYAWEAVVPGNAKTGSISIHAVDTASGVSADGSYTVKAVSDARYQIAKTAGDNQTGQPGAVLPQALRVLVRDDAGNPVSGMPVTFSASQGAVISPISAVTDANGIAQALLRLPPADGIALATAEAARQLVTFSAQAAHSGLAGFPSMSQNLNAPLGSGADTIAQKGALLTSVAAIVRYYQNRAVLPTPNGFADPQTLNQFLKTYCASDAQGGQICDGFIAHPDTQEQFVNLWRVGAFVNAALDLSVEKPDLNAIRDLLAKGSPVLLELATSLNGAFAGAHYVVATGLNSDASVAIMDPNPAYGRTNLNDYLAGFSTPQGTVKSTVDQIVRLVPQAPPSRGFTVYGPTAASILSPAGKCGSAFVLNPVAVPGGVPAAALSQSQCDGLGELYQIDVQPQSSAPFHLTFVDLGDPGNRVDLSGGGTVSYKVFRSGGRWTAAAQDLSFTPQGIVNAASFTPDIAPGGLFSIFGSGLSTAVGTTTVTLGGQPVQIVAQTPFQVNAYIPPDITPGTYTLHVQSSYGSLEQPVQIQAAAPGIFTVGQGQSAVTNQDGSLNTPDNPARRGEVIVIYCTGLGATRTQGQLHPVAIPALVLLRGSALTPMFAGLTPGFIGLYQVNVQIPVATPPGLNLPLSLQQQGATSNTVQISVQ